MKAYQIVDKGIDALKQVNVQPEDLKAGQVRVKMHAASLNYRDIMAVKGDYGELETPVIPCSDGAGEIVELGKDVKNWKVGDRVCPIFFQGWSDGALGNAAAKTALGGHMDGVLREEGVFNANGVVKIPDYLSYEEAACLPCAALTAWHALIVSGGIKSGDKVLMLGSGGVSIFALQIAKMHGCETIITSSDDDKLEKTKKLGADHVINYKKNPDWDKQVMEITKGKGVDHVIEVGGPHTMPKSVNSVSYGGHVAVIGLLAGKDSDFNPLSLLYKVVKLQGIYVGSRAMFEDMNTAFTVNEIRPQIDKVFTFDEAKEALKYQEAGKHFGKVVIKI